MPLDNYTAKSKALARQADLISADNKAHMERQALIIALGDLPEDIDDREISAIIIAACGGSRAEIGALLGHSKVDSTTHWRLRRRETILQAKCNISSVLSGIARLQLTQLLLSGLDAAREVVRQPGSDPEKRLATLARASRDLQSVCEYLDKRVQADAHSDRVGSNSYAVPPAMRNSLQASAASLHDLVDSATQAESVTQGKQPANT